MWNSKSWKMREGWVLAGALALVGVAVQLLAGPVDWDAFGWPVNVIVLMVFAALCIGIYLLRDKVYLFKFAGTLDAAVPAMALAVAFTIIMGLVRQVPAGVPAPDSLGFRYMLTSWPFVLMYTYMAVILSQAIIKEVTHWRWKAFPAFVFHCGLFTVLVAGTLGSADVLMLDMDVNKEQPVNRAQDETGRLFEVPLAVQLLDFDIDEYDPRIMLADSLGAPLSRPVQTLTVDSGFSSGVLGGWTLSLLERIETAVPAGDGFMHSDSVGTACALLLKAEKDGEEREGWVSCGSYLFGKKRLELSGNEYVVMRPRMPRRFNADVEIFTRDGGDYKASLAVNEPYSLDGWKIYLSDYDSGMGRWSETCVLELVRDPWMPAVYAGIFLMLLGALCLLFVKRK